MTDVAEFERLAVRVRAVADEVGLRRAALVRAGTPGWEGPAAEQVGERVQARAAALATLEEELGWLADAVRALAVAASAEEASGGLGRAS
ncbi:hypothetical protein [Phycicoccus avicenniae]|uniref:hypothetical protein n=1 Tax=Phycicoccus avicenniae TaxID=2828860 RepID=UPI003D2AA271